VLKAKRGARNGGPTSEVDVLRAKLAKPDPTEAAHGKGIAREEVPKPKPEAEKPPAAKLEAPAQPRRQPGVASSRARSGRASTPRKRRPEPAEQNDAIDRCRIEWWPRRSRSQFVAVIADGEERRPIAVSPAFRRRKNDPQEEREPATNALAELVERLEYHGWTQVGKGTEWFALEFRRAPRDHR
jgi:hypothetical protein